MNLKVNNFSLDYADITAQVSSYYPNSFGLYNVCGNVAEMVAEKGKAKGGSWKSFGGEVRIESVEYFNFSNSFGKKSTVKNVIGFSFFHGTSFPYSYRPALILEARHIFKYTERVLPERPPEGGAARDRFSWRLETDPLLREPAGDRYRQRSTSHGVGPAPPGSWRSDLHRPA